MSTQQSAQGPSSRATQIHGIPLKNKAAVDITKLVPFCAKALELNPSDYLTIFNVCRAAFAFRIEIYYTLRRLACATSVMGSTARPPMFWRRESNCIRTTTTSTALSFSHTLRLFILAGMSHETNSCFRLGQLDKADALLATQKGVRVLSQIDEACSYAIQSILQRTRIAGPISTPSRAATPRLPRLTSRSQTSFTYDCCVFLPHYLHTLLHNQIASLKNFEYEFSSGGCRQWTVVADWRDSKNATVTPITAAEQGYFGTF